MTHTVATTWLDNMAFEAEVSGHKIVMDADDEAGGENRGPRPKPLILSALGGCTAMDVIHILKKMRVDPSYFNAYVEGALSDKEPNSYTKFHLVYEFKADDGLDEKKVESAVRLSQDKYCSVAALLKDSAEITYEIRYL